MKQLFFFRKQVFQCTVKCKKKGYQKKFEDEMAKGNQPTAPAIPEELIRKMTERYITAYEKFTGHSL